jgi:hypothetical protein
VLFVLQVISHERAIARRRQGLTLVWPLFPPFQVPFELRAREGASLGALAGLVVSFDTAFECPTPIEFSTGVQTAPTHWKQTVFWLKTAPKGPMAAGDCVRGRFRLNRNLKNPRELDARVSWELTRGQGGVERGEQEYLLGS